MSNNKSNAIFVLPGTTEEESVSNLYRWLDTLATIIGLGHTLASASNGHRIPGVFHHLSRAEEQRFRERIDDICRQWHLQCLQGGVSAGFVVEVGGQEEDP